MKISANWLWPILGVASLFLLWYGAITLFHVRPFIAPSPFAVVDAIWENRAVLIANFVPTAQEAISGFLLGNAG